MTYILVIITHVYGGFTSHSVEFLSQEKCEIARDTIRADNEFMPKRYNAVYCFKK